MPFRVTARTILQLGAELISSDAVAFYELIKNAFDAGSPRVWIRVVTRMPHEQAASAREAVRDELPKLKKREREEAFERIRSEAAKHIDLSAPDAKLFRGELARAATPEALAALLEEANYIEFQDKGEGMTLQDLDEIYLTIGTRSRYRKREELRRRRADGDESDGFKPVLGEKGLGRLSTMRLGSRLRIESSKEGERTLNVLNIDWSWFSHDSDELLETVPVAPEPGPVKDDRTTSGTLIRISGLESEWSTEKLEDIARQEFSKLTDPFRTAKFPITLAYNGEKVAIPRINDLLFEHAHATVRAKFSVRSGSAPVLSGKVTYKGKEKVFELAGTHLLSVAGLAPERLVRSLGPFEVEAYWFNRRILTAIEGIGELKQVRELVAQWAGGLMLYRDGFRVLPYGGPGDDWLSLDASALAAAGYKVNRRQIIGKVDISSINNPRLVDQTNREGLRKSPETEVFVRLLQYLLMTQLRTFLDTVDRAEQATDTVRFEEIERRVESHEEQIRRNLELLVTRHPGVGEETEVLSALQEAVGQIRELMDRAGKLAKAFDKGRGQLVHLAGLGLIVESIAHELGRATNHTLITLAEAEEQPLPPELRGYFNGLEAQLKTLQKRLRALDPLSTATRQVKEKFDLVDWVRQTLDAHKPQFSRHGIECSLAVQPKSSAVEVSAVKGMFVQILENLINNSVYWLKQEKKLDRHFAPKIAVTIFPKTREIHFADNGPGIPPERKEEIFEPFVTTKPPGEGKGLGLYISREIAAYHGASLYLSDKTTAHTDALNTFVLALESTR
jgi:signal transduction histidine kinase